MKEISLFSPFDDINIKNNSIFVLIPESNSTFVWCGKQFIIVKFLHKNKIVKQAFYRFTGKSSLVDFKLKERGTWMPCDGIHHKIQENGLYGEIQTTDFNHEVYGKFGKLVYAKISYVLGGGIWISKDNEKNREVRCDLNKVKRELNIKYPRASFLGMDCLISEPRLINEFIYDAISQNLNGGSRTAIDFIHQHPSHKFYVPYVDEKDRNKNRRWYQKNIFPLYDEKTYMCEN